MTEEDELWYEWFLYYLAAGHTFDAACQTAEMKVQDEKRKNQSENTNRLRVQRNSKRSLQS